ncbi:MAG TPA: hypothetical protein VEO95_01235 [Chthoniobacteraceae bacterium]|nr:hypothetical protein [Chthoniobacteraceae bacterium]
MNTTTLLQGLFWTFAFFALFLLACFAVVMLLPGSFLGKQASAALTWLPPFIRGEALRHWAAASAERFARGGTAWSQCGGA